MKVVQLTPSMSNPALVVKYVMIVPISEAAINKADYTLNSGESETIMSLLHLGEKAKQ